MPAKGVSLRAGTQGYELCASAVALGPGYSALAKFRDDKGLTTSFLRRPSKRIARTERPQFMREITV